MPACGGVVSKKNNCSSEAPTTLAQIARPVPAIRMESASTAFSVTPGESFVRMLMKNSVRSIAIQVNTRPSGLSISTASNPNAVNASVPGQDAILGREVRAGDVNTTAAASPLKDNAYNQENGLANSCGEALNGVCGDQLPSINCQGKLTCQNRILIQVNSAPAAAASQV